ncbi:MAG TPA: class I SAM-dependent methyltransferase, partial [Desulfobacterales bacterium]|nr:class I SAM-dependent methyltransferase [Desulfobacterales bacterium]
MPDYRKRCYEFFVSKHWEFSHSLSQEQFEHLRKIYKRRFSNILPHDRSAKIIDIACGAGHFLYYLQKEGYINACGIDFSQEQLEIAKKMGVKNVQKADIFEYLPNNKETYDMIVANDII